MKKIVVGLVAATAVAAPIAMAGSAQAYDAPAQHPTYVNTAVTDPTTGKTTTITDIDLNVHLGDGSEWYHEFDLNYTRGVDGVVTFDGVGKQWDNGGEIITGSIDTNNHTVTYVAKYLNTSGQLDGRVWDVITPAPTSIATSGDIDFTGVWNGIGMTGGFHNVPAPVVDPAPADPTPADATPVATDHGNHGEFVSGAVKAGYKGKALAAIAQDGTLVGPFSTAKLAR